MNFLASLILISPGLLRTAVQFVTYLRYKEKMSYSPKVRITYIPSTAIYKLHFKGKKPKCLSRYLSSCKLLVKKIEKKKDVYAVTLENSANVFFYALIIHVLIKNVLLV